MPRLSAEFIGDLIRPIPELTGLREPSAPQERLDRIRSAARRVRERLLSGPEVAWYRTCDLVRVPYPTRYGLRDACSVPTPLLHILNRMFIIQLLHAGRVVTVLVSPSDLEGNAETPFFRRLARKMGPLRPLLEPVIAPRLGSVEGWLERLGVTPEQIDFITYDHLHTQDLRRWLGGPSQPAYFPNARLLVMRQEWESAHHLLPPQADWYCPGGLEGIPPERVVLLDTDVQIGAGLALVQTPGHTEGNHSVVVHCPEGLLVSSENGICADAYAPLESRIPGVRRYARATGMEVVLNGNTLERGLDQYLSMVLEKEIAGASPRNPSFCNVVPSSELAAWFLFPGLKPTFSFGELEFGAPIRDIPATIGTAA